MSKQINQNYRSSSLLTPTESIISKIWSDVLQNDDIRLENNFFELGGDSMMTMMVMFQVNETLNVEFSPDTLFEAPTLREFCNVIDRQKEKSTSQFSANNLPSDLLKEDTNKI